MNVPSEAGFVLVGIAALGIGAMLLSMAAAIRHGVSFIELEARVKALRAQQRQLLIERGMIEPDEGEIIEVDVVDDEEAIQAIPVDEDEPAQPERMAA
ncbi:MAG: hypothetical protein NCW75_08535 [Phycisphaera sp.]|nr:MAG: hypothetical protein NCW75_08535 [Phycisphaera sp.]